MPIPANLTFIATPVDRSLVMRALGGAITSPCSNDSESRRPTPTIFGLSPHLLVCRWMLLDSPIQITALSGRLPIVFGVHTWLVQLPLQNRIICMLNSFVSADRRATARTTTSLSHAAIRHKKSVGGWVALFMFQWPRCHSVVAAKVGCRTVQKISHPQSKKSVC